MITRTLRTKPGAYSSIIRMSDVDRPPIARDYDPEDWRILDELCQSAGAHSVTHGRRMSATTVQRRTTGLVAAANRASPRLAGRIARERSGRDWQ